MQHVNSNGPSSDIDIRPRVFIDLADDPAETCRSLGDALVASGAELYRSPIFASGLIYIGEGKAVSILKAKELAPRIVDHLRVSVIGGSGKPKGNMIPLSVLQIYLDSESFLSRFQPVDLVTSVRSYDSDWRIFRYGYNAGSEGHRTFLDSAGVAVEPANSLEFTNRFLDAMDFASEADRTAAVAGRLTVALHQHWPGGKPMLTITADKSQSGKDTTLEYMRGPSGKVALTYQPGGQQDWANEKTLAGLHAANPGAVVLAYENVRAGKMGVISSPSIERLITDPRPILYSTGTGQPIPVPNIYVVAMTTNEGQLNSDLANRSLPCHLTTQGDPHARTSPIGDPREYLRTQVWELHAETLGIIQRWVDAGKPLDTSARHNFRSWASHIGGMLAVSGFPQFLANFGYRRGLSDTERELVARLGSREPDKWLRAREWVQVAQVHRLTAVIPAGWRNGDLSSQETGMGIALSKRVGEQLWTMNETEAVCLRIEKSRPSEKNGKTCYRFVILERRMIAE